MRRSTGSAMVKAYRPSAPVRVFALAVGFFLAAPVFIIVPLSLSTSQYLEFPPPGWSLQWYRAFLGSEAWRSALGESLRLGLAVTLVATALGTSAAYGISRMRRGRRWLVAFLLSPLIVPVVVLAISLYGLFVRIGISGGFGAILVGHAVIATPLVVIAVIASLHKLDPSLEKASMSLGAGPIETFLRVVVPAILPGICSGALLAFITSFDELVLAMFVGGTTMTLPRKIWEDLIVMIEPTQAAASTVLLAVSTALLALWATMQRSRR